MHCPFPLRPVDTFLLPPTLNYIWGAITWEKLMGWTMPTPRRRLVLPPPFFTPFCPEPGPLLSYT